MSASTTSGENGTTAQAASAGIRDITGARKNNPVLAWLGEMISLKNSFMPSATGCSRPSGPTRFGPIRICIQPMSLRSHRVR